MGIGAIASIAAPVIGGLFGGKKQGAVTSQSIPPFEQWPDEVKKKWLDEVVGGASAATTQNPFDPIPMTRVSAPQTPFDSQALYDWQRFSDSKGGLFSSLFPDNKQTAAPETPSQDAESQFTPQDAVFIKQYESGQLPQKPYAQEYQDALKRREKAGKIPAPMGGYVK